jgi:(S)-sulfolactate dehydrogenase
VSDIVICEFMDEGVVRRAFDGHDVLYDPALSDTPEKLLPCLADARALVVRNRTQVRGELLAAAPKLRVVGRLGVGLDNIDLEACKARGIAVRPATGANDAAVAEYVVTAALVLLRRAWFATSAVSGGEWPRMALMGREVAGKALGLVGFGAIARETARRAIALGMTVSAYDPYLGADAPAWSGVKRCTLETLLSESDVVSLHVPLTPETRQLIDARALGRMKPDAILINAARGGVLDEPALVTALKERRLGGAALDVFEREPLDAVGGARFEGVPNLILTPHIAGVTGESNVRVSEVIARAVLAELQ